MPIQTSYTAVLPAAVAGMVADMRDRVVISREVMSTSAAIQFGAPVLRGNSDHSCAAVGTSGAGAILGIAVLDPTVAPAANNALVAPFTAPVMTRGVIWVQTAGAVTAGAPAYYTPGGAITATSSGNTALTTEGGKPATFETTLAGAGLAILRLG